MKRGLRFALCQEDGSGGLFRDGMQHRCIERGRDLRQLVGRVTSRWNLTRGKRDLGERGEKPGSSHPVLCLFDGQADAGQSGPDLTLGQPEQGQARLWAVAKLAGLTVTLIGQGELSPETMELRLLVEGHPDRGLAGES